MIRAALIPQLLKMHPQAKLIPELGLHQGAVRADLSLLDFKEKYLWGYEIKSSVDTLTRLPTQAKVYGEVFSQATLVCSQKHLESARALLPSWWGLTIAEATGASAGVRLTSIRTATDNPAVDSLSLAQLLWRQETLEVLEEHGWDRGVRSRPRRFLWQRLADNMPLQQLQSLVIQTLLSRTDWRE